MTSFYEFVCNGQLNLFVLHSLNLYLKAYVKYLDTVHIPLKDWRGIMFHSLMSNNWWQDISAFSSKKCCSYCLNWIFWMVLLSQTTKDHIILIIWIKMINLVTITIHFSLNNETARVIAHCCTPYPSQEDTSFGDPSCWGTKRLQRTLVLIGDHFSFQSGQISFSLWQASALS